MSKVIYTTIASALLVLSGCGGSKKTDESVDTPNEPAARDAAPGPLSETTRPETPPPPQE